jgi:TatD DNase family protein
MIIDSHAHYAHPKYSGEFPYLCEIDGEYAVARSDREELFSEMHKQGIVHVIEPSIGFDAIENQIELVEKHREYMSLVLGVHPTRCTRISYGKRKELKRYAENHNIAAVGETGLDYHQPRKEQHRFRQKRWFVYQIKLADKLRMPLVLHVRDAYGDALKILKKYSKKLHGGVAHCFTGNATIAEEYISLGYAIGIGGKLLCDNEIGRELCETVKRIPLSSILVETDAPLVFPDLRDDLCGSNQKRKLCNSSLILPSVIRKIAELRHEDEDKVEKAIYENTLRVFALPERI